MRLKDSILKKIKQNDKIRIAIMDLHEVKESTVLRWLRENDTMLCHHSTLLVISARLKKDIDEMIIQEECDFKQVI